MGNNSSTNSNSIPDRIFELESENIHDPNSISSSKRETIYLRYNRKSPNIVEIEENINNMNKNYRCIKTDININVEENDKALWTYVALNCPKNTYQQLCDDDKNKDIDISFCIMNRLFDL